MAPTKAAEKFVGLETWRELSENPTATDVFDAPISHVHLARKADLVVVAPATADLLAKMRAGLAPDLLTNVLLASDAPRVVAPAMHTNMWQNPATQENIETLKKWGTHVVAPVSGALSSGDTGAGRMAEPEEIFDFALEVARKERVVSEAGVAEVAEDKATRTEALNIGEPEPLAGKHVVVTAGGTRENLDPVRFLGNRSTGAQGIAIAEAALAAGATVSLIHGAVEVTLPEHENLKVSQALSTKELQSAVEASLEDADALVMAAAVADFTPKTESDGKIKKTEGEDSLTLELKKTPDILAGVSSHPLRPSVLVGFGAETGTLDEVLELGRAKARRKGADLLAVNRVGRNVGFGSVPNTLHYVDADGEKWGEVSGSKSDVAEDLVGRISEMLKDREVGDTAPQKPADL